MTKRRLWFEKTRIDPDLDEDVPVIVDDQGAVDDVGSLAMTATTPTVQLGLDLGFSLGSAGLNPDSES